MTQWLRTLYWSSVPSSHASQLTTTHKSSSVRLKTLFWLPSGPVYTHTDTQIKSNKSDSLNIMLISFNLSGPWSPEKVERFVYGTIYMSNWLLKTVVK